MSLSRDGSYLELRKQQSLILSTLGNHVSVFTSVCGMRGFFGWVLELASFIYPTLHTR